MTQPNEATDGAAVGSQVDRQVRPFAWALTHRDGRVTLHTADEYAIAYRDTCVAETPLYTMPEKVAEFEVQDSDGMVQAVASGPRAAAFNEAMNYARQYEQDGPVTIWEVLRVQLG